MGAAAISPDQARQLYNDAIVIDALNVSNWQSPAVFASLAAGGVTAINATLVTWENYQQTMGHTATWRRRLWEHRDVLTPITAVNDIHTAKQDGKVGVIAGWQNATPLENDLSRLELFYETGVRIIQLTFHERNLLGNGCWERRDDGLSNFGVDAVRQMNELGILIDLSHCGDRTTLEAIELSKRPAAFTHANARAFCDHRRNKPDDAIRLLAQRGGVVGATCFCNFLPNGSGSTIDDFADAIDDLVDRAGIDHVGIGSDFTQDQPRTFWDYIGSQQGTKLPSVFYDPAKRVDDRPTAPAGLETPDKLPCIAQLLAKRGYNDQDITRILGGNWLRLFEAVWH